MNDWFHAFATKMARWSGHPIAFIGSVVIIVAWAATGPMFNYSDTWQLVINTGTTIITFLMVFLIQNTQNRDARAMHLKLDELIKGVKGARTKLVDLEEMSEDELRRLEAEFKHLRDRYDKHEKKVAPHEASGENREPHANHQERNRP
jgi:low affinity Fe/Cu permease